MADPNVAQCFWTYPDATLPVAPGRALTFQIVVPGPSALFPVSGSVVNWRLTDTTMAAQPYPLVAGDDYRVLAGGLESASLSLVFKPIAGRKISVAPTLSLFYAAAGAIVKAVSNPTDYPELAGQTYSLAGVASTQQVIDTIMSALCLTVKKTVLEPGEAALLKLLPRSMVNAPQLVTSIVHEAPSVEIRGAIPLDNLVEAIVGPISGALGRVLPGSKTALAEAGDEIKRLLGEPLAIPVAVDILGKRVSKTLSPVGDAQTPVITSIPEETGSIEGLVPIGQWQSLFTIKSVKWAATPQEGSADLSPGFDGFVKSFLLKPALVPFSVGGAAPVPTSTTVTATVYIDLESGVFTGPVNPPHISVTLFVLPLTVPQVAAAFKNGLTYNEDDQEVFVVTDPVTSTFAPSAEDLLRLLTRLVTVLNTIVSFAKFLGAGWSDLMDAASVASVLADKLGRIDRRSIYLIPIWPPDYSVEVDEDWISAMIYVGPPGVTFFLRDSNGPAYITFRTPSILPNLHGAFGGIRQIPANSATASHGNYNYGDKMEILDFQPLSVIGTPVARSVSPRTLKVTRTSRRPKRHR